MCQLPKESVDFLGDTFGLHDSPKTGRADRSPRPSKRSISRLIKEIHAQTAPKTVLRETPWEVARWNRLLTGWSYYFCLGSVSPAYRAIDAYTTTRWRRWLCKQHKKRPGNTTCYPDRELYQRGLVCLPKRARSSLWAKA